MGFFTAVGMIVCAALGILFALIVWHIASNIFWGIVGALRFRRIVNAKTNNWPAIRWVIRAGLKNWLGQPSTYWCIGGYGGQGIPVDGRYPLPEYGEEA